MPVFIIAGLIAIIIAGLNMKHLLPSKNSAAPVAKTEANVERSALESKPLSDKIDVCAESKGLCIQMFAPASCSVKIGDDTFKQSGSNSCYARSALMAEFCTKKIDLSADVAKTIVCHDDAQ